MRKKIYIIIFIIALVGGIELLRNYNLSRLPAPIAAEQTKKSSIKSSSFGDYLTASVSQRSGDFETAIKFYEQALEEDEDNVEILNKLYGLYLFKGEYEKAIELAEVNIERDRSQNKKPNKLSIVPYLITALKEFKQDNSKEVIRILEPLADPEIPNISHLDGVVSPLVLAWAYAVDEDYKNSFRIIDNITADYMLSIFSYNRSVINDLANNKEVLIDGKNYPTSIKSKKLLAEVFFELGQYSLQNKSLEEAVVYFRFARYLDSESYKIKKLLAVSFEAMNRLEEAIKIYDTVNNDDSEYTEALFSKAIAYNNLNKSNEAVELLESIKDDKYSYQVNYAIGSIYMNKKNFRKAIYSYKQAEKDLKEPTQEQWGLFFNLGIAYDKTGNWEKAEESLKKSVQLYPDNPETLNYLAYSWLTKNKNIKQAREMLESAVIKSGGAPHILDSYGWALYKLGHYSEATPFLEQASLALPYNSVINSHLGDLYWSLSRKKEALYQWKKARDYFDAENSDEIKLEDIKNKIENGL